MATCEWQKQTVNFFKPIKVPGLHNYNLFVLN